MYSPVRVILTLFSFLALVNAMPINMAFRRQAQRVAAQKRESFFESTNMRPVAMYGSGSGSGSVQHVIKGENLKILFDDFPGTSFTGAATGLSSQNAHAPKSTNGAIHFSNPGRGLEGFSCQCSRGPEKTNTSTLF
ncbi:hypothetical protein PM082_019901 [Marasmius tenuissimus]|nr:hypothetical protein PM082_019901 [Marasmius tenuissimus]